MTRITQRLIVQHSMASLQTGLGRLANSQEKLSTGRLINRPSDSPTGTNEAMRLRAQLSADTQHARNAQDGLAYMGQVDSTLSTMLDNVRRARNLLVQGASTGSTGPEAREALAQELTQIREALLSLANTSHLGRPIFGGTTGSAAAYGSTGFIGDEHPVHRTVDNGVSVRIDVNGPEAFGPKGADLFAVLTKAIDDLQNNPAAIGGNLDPLDAVTERMKTALTGIGARYARIEAAAARVDQVTLTNKAALSEVENVDVAEAIMDLQMQEVAYQAALGATARVLQPSLIDFLR
jgi:flagellar hook-associated protein 3 FlgL